MARPESRSITLSLLAYESVSVYIDWGVNGPESRSTVLLLKPDDPLEFPISNLEPDKLYHLHVHWRRTDADTFNTFPELLFHTARAEGHAFSFTLTADAHLDEHTSPTVYLRSLANVAADRPDFHIDLGNLFMTDKHATRAEALQQYVAQRYYLSQIGAQLLLALGTHDGEAGRYDDGSADCLAVWSNVTRKRFFPNPLPDTFFAGNTHSMPYRGLPQNYYAFTWGDALFVVLDPFANTVPVSSRKQPNNDGWSWTLGSEQYDFLKRTLESSRAHFKFVFIHNLLRGDASSRGGIEFAAFNEWGGKNPDGSEGFASHRAGWSKPVHQLLLDYHVSAVLRAHDNFYAHQSLDGIAYVMVPQPSFAGNDRIRDLQTYGYKSGVFLGNSGHLRIQVAGTKATVSYVKSLNGHGNQTVADEFTIP